MKKALFAVLAAMAVTSLYAEDVVRLGNLKFAHYGAVWYMKEIAPKYGLKIEEKIFAKGLDIIPGILAGDIDIAASALDAAIAGRGAGAPVYVVAGFAKGGVRIVGRSDLNLKRIADLKGKTVGVARGGAQELCLLAELAKAHLTWSDKGDKDVHLVYLAYADLNGALLNKNIDAMCQSEPQSTQAISKGFGKEINRPYDTPMGEPVRALVMTAEMYDKKRDVAARVLKCFVDATKYFLDHPDFAEKYVREQVFKGQLTAEEYKDAMNNAGFTYDITPQHVQVTTDMMMQYGVGRMEHPPKAGEWVRTDLLAAAKKALKAK
ncbi:MAG TPA: ABC transporter substrate-binding protein [Thermoanaerobaculia bacterium]|nr:ABC transporter substrate-binding protein [Thermoanaerobaculia bacterium]